MDSCNEVGTRPVATKRSVPVLTKEYRLCTVQCSGLRAADPFCNAEVVDEICQSASAMIYFTHKHKRITDGFVVELVELDSLVDATDTGQCEAL